MRQHSYTNIEQTDFVESEVKSVEKKQNFVLRVKNMRTHFNFFMVQFLKDSKNKQKK